MNVKQQFDLSEKTALITGAGGHLGTAMSAAVKIDVLVNNGLDRLGADWRSVTAEQFNRHLRKRAALVPHESASRLTDGA